MSRSHFQELLRSVIQCDIEIQGNFIAQRDGSDAANQQQTNDAFTEKWSRYGESAEQEKLYAFQLKWYLRLYGFESESALKDYLGSVRLIVDAGCGLGYKAAWFARLAPHALVVGIDFSDAALQAAHMHHEVKNLFFVKGDIANTFFCDHSVGFVSCDQVIMHTEDPEKTFAELARITAKEGELACYFYAKKALPRELLDDYFRMRCKEVSHKELWEMSEQLTELGRRLTNLNVTIDTPDIPLLGIVGGPIDIQRFVYWNFLKCFWNAELGEETSIATNFDWYSPSNARRFSEDEVLEIVAANTMKPIFFHGEEACYSGRFSQNG
jgi:SAM-dependent methyltransferase